MYGMLHKNPQKHLAFPACDMVYSLPTITVSHKDDHITVFSSADHTANEDRQMVPQHLVTEGLHPSLPEEPAANLGELRLGVQVPLREAEYAKVAVANGSHTDQPNSRILGDQETVFRAQNSITAEVEAFGIVALLESSGVAAVIVGDHNLPNMPLEVRVESQHAPYARRLIAEANEAQKSVSPESTIAVVATRENQRTEVGSRKGSPWTANACGWMAFWFGPIVGCVVTFVNLRRLKKTGAAVRALIFGPLVVIVIIGILAFILDLFFPSKTIPAIVGAIVSRLVFQGWQDGEFDNWKRDHPDKEPSRWWTMLPWVVIGIILTIPLGIIAFGMMDE
jgi:hypothetical protein